MEETSIARHKDDRKVKSADEEKMEEESYLAEEFDEVKVESDGDIEEENEPSEENPTTKESLQPVEEASVDEENNVAKISEETEEPSLFPDTSFQMKTITNLKLVLFFGLHDIIVELITVE